MVGLIKTALALRHRTIPPTVHVREPNALLTDVPLRLADTIRPWPARNGRRVAGVSSFGMSGTNVHLVLAEAPATEPPKREGKQVTFVLPVSARAVGAVRDLSRAYGEQVSAATTEELSDICFSAGVRRTHHEYRMAVVASDGMEMAARLGEYAWGRQPEAVVASDRKVFDSPGWSSCSPARAASGPGWAASSTGPTPCSATGCTSATRRSGPNAAGPLWTS
ncbi:hypothetical protein GCM10029964_038860 [Kibdelosporangium lantanae]